jgi:hypothetical protein
VKAVEAVEAVRDAEKGLGLELEHWGRVVQEAVQGASQELQEDAQTSPAPLRRGQRGQQALERDWGPDSEPDSEPMKSQEGE